VSDNEARDYMGCKGPIATKWQSLHKLVLTLYRLEAYGWDRDIAVVYAQYRRLRSRIDRW
jgi:hypothetical protein